MQSQASATVVWGGVHPNVDAFPPSASAVKPSASPRLPVVQGQTVPAPSAGLCERQTQGLEFVAESRILEAMTVENRGKNIFSVK